MGTGIGFFLTILLFCCGSPASAQELSSPWLGTHFLVALPDTVTNRRGNIRTFPDNSPELILFTLEETNVSFRKPVASSSTRCFGPSPLLRILSRWDDAVCRPGRPAGPEEPENTLGETDLDLLPFSLPLRCGNVLADPGGEVGE